MLHAFRQFADKHFEREIVADGIARHEVAKEDFVVQAAQPRATILHQCRFRQSAVSEIEFHQACYLLSVLYECILLFEVKTIGIEIFGKGIRVHLLYHIPAAQRGGNLARKHFGVASGDIYIIFMVC